MLNSVGTATRQANIADQEGLSTHAKYVQSSWNCESENANHKFLSRNTSKYPTYMHVNVEVVAQRCGASMRGSGEQGGDSWSKVLAFPSSCLCGYRTSAVTTPLGIAPIILMRSQSSYRSMSRTTFDNSSHDISMNLRNTFQYPKPV